MNSDKNVKIVDVVRKKIYTKTLVKRESPELESQFCQFFSICVIIDPKTNKCK